MKTGELTFKPADLFDTAYARYEGERTEDHPERDTFDVECQF